MSEFDPKIAELEARLDSLVRTEIGFQTEISTIRRELTKLRGGTLPSPTPVTMRLDEPKITPPPPSEPKIPPYQRPTPHVSAGDASQNEPPPIFGMKPDAAADGSSGRSESAFSNYARLTPSRHAAI